MTAMVNDHLDFCRWRIARLAKGEIDKGISGEGLVGEWGEWMRRAN